MKKVIVIVDKNTTEEQMEAVREAILNHEKSVIVGNEISIKQVINIEFDDVNVDKRPVKYEMDCSKLTSVIKSTINEIDSRKLINIRRIN